MNLLRVATFFICLTTFFCSHAAPADTRRGAMPIDHFLALWNSGNSEKVGVAYGYLLGTVDAMIGESPVCLPQQPEWSVIFKRVVQEVDAVKRNLATAGVQWEGLPATTILDASFRRAYPCSGMR